MQKALLALLTTLCLGGCALDIRTTGYLDRAAGLPAFPRGATFAVLENAQVPNPLFDREIKAKIERLIAFQGYRVEAPDGARYLLAYSYSIHPGLRSGTVTSYGSPQTQIQRVPDGKGGVTTRAVTVQGAPSVVPTIMTEYTRQLTLKVMAGAGAGEERSQNVIWVGETLNTDPSSDLRADIDYLLVATFLYFGRDTGRQVGVRISRDDAAVRELRREAGLPVR